MPQDILLLEDDDHLRRLFSRRITDAGHNCQSASRVSEAIKQLEAGFEPRVFIVDINLPDAKGTELLKYLHRHPEFDDAIKIIVSANPYEQASSDAEYTVQTRLLKPVSPRHLLTVINNELAKQVRDQAALMDESSVRVYWLDDTHEIAVMELAAKWTWDDYNHARKHELHPMFESVSHPVHLIFDLTYTDFLPNNTLLKIREILKSRHANFSGNIVFVGAKSGVRVTLRAANDLVISRFAHVSMRFADTMQEAKALISAGKGCDP